MKQKLPVFYHIPKNAGSFISTWMLMGFRAYRRLNTDWLHKYLFQGAIRNRNNESCKTILVMKNDLIVARFFVGDPKYDFDKNESATRLSPSDFKMDFASISTILTNYFVFYVSIESYGFRIADQILSLLNNEKYDLQRFLVLRDPFSRAQSLFFYNSSEISKHDYSHSAFKCKTLEQYILSEQLEDSWLIRNLLNIEDSEPLTEQDFEKAVALLKSSFRIYELKQAHKAVSEILIDCYQLNPDEFIFHKEDKDAISLNKNNYTTNKLESLPLNVQEIFKKRTFLDQKMYDKLCST
jgi:hypothetical protein